MMISSKMNKLTNIKHYKKEHVKALFARYGRESGINPGVLWPRKEELKYLKEYEKAFCPKLEDLIAENREKKEVYRKYRQEREQEVLRKLEKLPSEFKNFFDKIDEKQREKDQWLKEREALIEEVREILGFRAKPSDERFQKALAEKEEADEKARKKEARKKRENAGLEELLGTTIPPTQSKR